MLTVNLILIKTCRSHCRSHSGLGTSALSQRMPHKNCRSHSGLCTSALSQRMHHKNCRSHSGLCTSALSQRMPALESSLAAESTCKAQGFSECLVCFKWLPTTKTRSFVTARQLNIDSSAQIIQDALIHDAIDGHNLGFEAVLRSNFSAPRMTPGLIRIAWGWPSCLIN